MDNTTPPGAPGPVIGFDPRLRPFRANGDGNLTVIRAISPGFVGKTYSRDKAGEERKEAVATIFEGIGFPLTVPDAAAMQSLLEVLTKAGDLAVCSGHFNDTDGQPFRIATAKGLAKELKVQLRDVPAGVQVINGERVAARLKHDPREERRARGIEATEPLLLDADNPEGIPEAWAVLDLPARLAMLEKIVPGISACERVELRGSTSRVVRTGGAPGPRTHAWIRVSDPDMVETLREGVRVRMVNANLSFLSPRRSRETGGIIGHEPRTVLDLATWQHGRLAFCSRPDVRIDGCKVADADVTIVNEGAGPLDISGVSLPGQDEMDEYKRRTGHDISYSPGGGRLRVAVSGALTPDTIIEHRGREKTAREWLSEMKEGDKLRCEAPFRASSSEAAFLLKLTGERAFVYDAGTGISYFMGTPAEFDFADLPAEPGEDAEPHPAPGDGDDGEDAAAEEEEEEDEGVPDGLLDGLRAYPVVAALLDYCDAHQREPAPALLIGTVISVLSAAAGRGWRLDYADQGRLNLVVLGVASSGRGKDASSRAAAKVVDVMARDMLLRGAAGSTAGLLDLLSAPQTGGELFWLHTEAGEVLRGMCGDRRVGQHMQNLGETVLDLFTSATSFFQERPLARDRRARGPAPLPRRIREPYLAALWMTTPEGYDMALDGTAAAQTGRGTTNRLLVFREHGDADPALRRRGWRAPGAPPDAVILWAHVVRAAGQDEGLRVIGIERGVMEALDDAVLVKELRARIARLPERRQRIARDVAGRAEELTLKVAGLLALARVDPVPVMARVEHSEEGMGLVEPRHVVAAGVEAPVVTVVDFALAWRLVRWCIASATGLVVDAHENPDRMRSGPEKCMRQAERILVEQRQRDRNRQVAARGWMSRRDLMRRGGGTMREWTEALGTLLEAGTIEEGRVPVRGKAVSRYRLARGDG
ncbi:hypothetical protein AAFN86_19590 [Roseomonas sp. CAU 1739]|uniref:hypothetical protein n=1 Tax=Roseomonas sp. CAU 1739 TaxID=3140364 RepID=UPI00325AAE52